MESFSSHTLRIRVSVNSQSIDIADVCMDETAVSNDAIATWLLDEKVVKDWVRWTYQNVTKELQQMCIL